VQLALTICGVAYAIAVIELLVDGGNAMACFDGDRLACTADPVALRDLWRSLIAGAILIATAAVAVVVAYQHRRGRARRSASIGVLSMSAALDGLAAIVLLSL